MIETLLAVMLAFGTPAGVDQPNQVLPAATSSFRLLASSLPAGYYKQAQRNLRVYTHPRRNAYVFDQLYRGEIVLVDRCRRRWCLINHYDDWGWVKRKHLVSVRNQRDGDRGSIDLGGLRFWFDFKL